MSLVTNSPHQAGFLLLSSVHLQSHLAGHLLDPHMNQSYAHLCTFAPECPFLSSHHNTALPDPRAQLNAHLLHTAFSDYAKIPSVLGIQWWPGSLPDPVAGESLQNTLGSSQYCKVQLRSPLGSTKVQIFFQFSFPPKL